MTLVVGVVTPRGVVISADGLVSVGAVQVPGEKVFQIGNVFGCGISGNDNIYSLAVAALRQSPLAQAAPDTYTGDQATILARAALNVATTAYLQNVTWVTTQPIDNQIGSAHILLGGLCSDGPLLVALDNRGNSYPLLRPHYTAIGSGRDAAFLLMQAYSAYDYAAHPLDTSVLLTKRVLDQVSAAIPNIGGALRILAISVQAGETGDHAHFVDLASAKVRTGLATWQELEAEMFESLAAWTTPDVQEPGGEVANEAQPRPGLGAVAANGEMADA